MRCRPPGSFHSHSLHAKLRMKASGWAEVAHLFVSCDGLPELIYRALGPRSSDHGFMPLSMCVESALGGSAACQPAGVLHNRRESAR